MIADATGVGRPLPMWLSLQDDSVLAALLHPGSREVLGFLLLVRYTVVLLSSTLLATVFLLGDQAWAPFFELAVLNGFVLAVTILFHWGKRRLPARLLPTALLAVFLSDITVELLALGASDLILSAFLLFPLLTVVVAAMVAGTRTAVLCVIWLSMGYPLVVTMTGHLMPLDPPFSAAFTVQQHCYLAISQAALMALALAPILLIISKVRALARGFRDRLHVARQQIEEDARNDVAKQHLLEVGRMTSHLAHELRNPLSTILISAELVEMDIEDHALVRESTSEIKDQTLRLSRMLTEILDYTREIEPSARKHDLYPFLEDLVDSTRADIEIGWDGPLTLPVFADPDHVQQVLRNLVRNAVQAVGSGGKVLLRGELLDNEQVVIEVHDDGPAVSAEDRERIFEAFFTTKAKGEGTGLGLAICRRLCQKNGMWLEVGDSDDLGGARFRLVLPFTLSDRPLESLSGPDAWSRLPAHAEHDGTSVVSHFEKKKG